jgi:signal transduction histidine kinase
MTRIELHPASRVFIIVLGAVFAVEFAIMLVVETTGIARADRWTASLADALLLVLVLSPVLWLLIVRPLRSAAALRGEVLARTLETQEEERARIARELHDELGQAQTAMLLAARYAAQSTDLGAARAAADEIARMAADAIVATRRLARGLAPAVLNDLGLAAAVERLCDDVSAASGLAIERSVTLPLEPLVPSIALHAFRIVQEAMTNAVRHAKATRLSVTIRATGDALVIEVPNTTAPRTFCCGRAEALAGCVDA